MSGSPLHSVSVAGVAFDTGGRVLLIRRRDNDQWQPPGGVLDLSEKLEDGVVREVLEETQVTVNVEHLAGVYKNMPSGVVALVYRCSVREDSAKPGPSAESVESVWLPLDEAARRMSPVFAVRVRDAADLRNMGASRNHDGQKLLTYRGIPRTR